MSIILLTYRIIYKIYLKELVVISILLLVLRIKFLYSIFAQKIRLLVSFFESIYVIIYL